MGKRILYFISVLSLGALLLCFSDSKELSRELTCYQDALSLECGGHEIIAIHQAYFTSQRQENFTCDSNIEHDSFEDDQTANYTYCYEDVRVKINRRCSGLTNCNFSYSEEIEKQCFNQDGVLIVLYDCVRAENINKYCNAKITASEGYIVQPGYPKYYPQLSDCNWSLSAAEGQTILVKILHLHLSAATEVTPTVSDHDSAYGMGLGQQTEQITQCDTDSLSVLEGNVKRSSVCGEDSESLKTFEADASNDLVLKFKSAGFLPASGFLAYFKIQGCPDMPAGEDSYLVERNGTAAIYACHDDMVFNDTLVSTRFLHCIRNHHWSNTLSPCIQLTYETSTLSTISFITAIELQLENITIRPHSSVTTISPKARLTEDIVIPCIIIGVLLLGNVMIVILIFIIRKNQRNKQNEEEEDFGQPTQSEEEVLSQPSNSNT